MIALQPVGAILGGRAAKLIFSFINLLSRAPMRGQRLGVLAGLRRHIRRLDPNVTRVRQWGAGESKNSIGLNTPARGHRTLANYTRLRSS
jgi:hypothetical protein